LCMAIQIYLRYQQELEKLHPTGKIYFQRWKEPLRLIQLNELDIFI
jgi:hypothetical protein